MSESVRVLLADDQALLRGALRILVESEPGLEIVGEATDGAEAVELTRARLVVAAYESGLVRPSWR